MMAANISGGVRLVSTQQRSHAQLASREEMADLDVKAGDGPG